NGVGIMVLDLLGELAWQWNSGSIYRLTTKSNECEGEIHLLDNANTGQTCIIAYLCRNSGRRFCVKFHVLQSPQAPSDALDIMRPKIEMEYVAQFELSKLPRVDMARCLPDSGARDRIRDVLNSRSPADTGRDTASCV